MVTKKEKGRAVVAEKSFTKGEFICEYAGDLSTRVEGKQRDKVYAKDPLTGAPWLHVLL